MQLLKVAKRDFLYNFGHGYSLPPESVTIEVNYQCMFHCQMCQMWKKDFEISRIGDNKILSKYEIEAVIDELSFLRVKSISFCGGEPFLRKDLLDIVKYCKSRMLHCSTFTNGYLIREDLAQNIVLSGIDSISISIDSAKSELHDEIRGFKGAFDHAVEGIRLIKKQQKEYNTDLPKIFIHCTVSSKNFLNLPEMVDLAKSLDIRRIRFNYLSVVDRNTVEMTNRMIGEKVIGFHTFVDISPAFLLQRGQIEQLEFIIEDIKERAGSEVKCDLDPALLNGDKDLLQKGKFPVLKCNAPWRSAVITPIGDVVPCSMFTDYKMGNLRERSFEEIWNSKRARDIRRLLSKGLPPICQKCCGIHIGVPNLWKRFYRKLLKDFMEKSTS